MSVYRKTGAVYSTRIKDLSLESESYAKRLRYEVITFYTESLLMYA
jgi:hypothetical protein